MPDQDPPVGVVGKEGKRAKKARRMIIKPDKVDVRVSTELWAQRWRGGKMHVVVMVGIGEGGVQWVRFVGKMGAVTQVGGVARVCHT